MKPTPVRTIRSLTNGLADLLQQNNLLQSPLLRRHTISPKQRSLFRGTTQSSLPQNSLTSVPDFNPLPATASSYMKMKTTGNRSTVIFQAVTATSPVQAPLHFGAQPFPAPTVCSNCAAILLNTTPIILTYNTLLNIGIEARAHGVRIKTPQPTSIFFKNAH